MKFVGLLYVVLACLGWATACLFVNGLTLCGFNSLQNAAGRCLVAALFLIAFMLIKYKRFVKVTWKQLIPVAIGGISFYGMAATYFYAITHTSASTASMLLCIAPIFVATVSVLFFKEKMTLKKAASILALLFGCSLVVGLFEGFRFHPLGILMGSLSGLLYAIYSICTKIAMRSGLEPEVHVTYSFCFSALASMLLIDPVELCLKIAEEPFPAAPLIIGIGFATGAFAGLMYTKGMKLLPAGVTSALAVLEQIISVLLSVVFLQEQIGSAAAIGIVLVIGSVMLLGAEA